MPVENVLVVAAQSCLFAGFLFVVRWWAETRGVDRASTDRRVALVLVSLSLSLTLLGILLELAGGR